MRLSKIAILLALAGPIAHAAQSDRWPVPTSLKPSIGWGGKEDTPAPSPLPTATSFEAKAIQALQALKARASPTPPLSPQPESAAETPAPEPSMQPMFPRVASFVSSVESLKNILSSPTFQKAAKVAMNPEMQNRTLLLLTHSNRNWIFLAEGSWILLFLILRAWISGKAKNFFQRLAIGLAAYVAYLIVAFAFVPWIVFGDSYIQFCATMTRLWEG